MIFLGQDETIKYIDVVETPRVLPTPTLDYSDNATLTGLNTLITATNMPDNATLYVNGIEKTGNTFMLTPDNTAYSNNYIYTVSVQYKKDNYTDSETVTYHYHVRNVAPIVSQDSAVVSSGGFDFSISRPDTVYTSSNDLKVMIGWLDNSHAWQTVQNPNNFIITSTVGGMTDSPIGAQYNFKVAATNYMDDSEIITRYYHNAATEYMPTPEITVSANSFLISTEYPYDPDNGFYMQSGATLYYSINGTTTSVDFSTASAPSVTVQHTMQQGDTISAYIVSTTGFKTSDTATYTYVEPAHYDHYVLGVVTGNGHTNFTPTDNDTTIYLDDYSLDQALFGIYPAIKMYDQYDNPWPGYDENDNPICATSQASDLTFNNYNHVASVINNEYVYRTPYVASLIGSGDVMFTYGSGDNTHTVKLFTMTITQSRPPQYDPTSVVNDILGTDYTNVEYDSTLDSEYIETTDEILYGQQA